MPFPPTDWGDWTTGEYEVGAPATSLHFERWFRNPVALAQGADGAPKNLGKSMDIDIGNLTGVTAIVDLDDAAKVLLVATAQHDTAISITPVPSIGYQLSSSNGSTWGPVVVIASGKYLASGSDTNSGVAAGARIIDMTGMNAIRLSGTGTLSGSLIWVEGE